MAIGWTMKIRLSLSLAALFAGAAFAQMPSPHAIDIPSWFATTFLDFREDVDDAAREGKRLLVYFGQDGCPYCAKLMATNFAQRSIVDKTREHFVASGGRRIGQGGHRDGEQRAERGCDDPDRARAHSCTFASVAPCSSKPR